MSYSLEATRRRLVWWYLALPVCVALLGSPPFRPLLVAVRGVYLFPAWVLLAHLHTSFSHALMTGSVKKGWGFFRNTWLAYGEARSGIHWQTAMLVALAEETLFRGLLLWPVLAVTSPGVAVAGTSVLFALVHKVNTRRRLGLRALLDLFLLGLLLGGVTVWTRSIYPALLVHGWRNYLLRCLLVSKEEVEERGGAVKRSAEGRSQASDRVPSR